jgi:hypothetical protein
MLIVRKRSITTPEIVVIVFFIASHQLKLKKAARSNNQTPDTKVSRNFTFRVQEDQSPTKKKKRTRRPDPDDDDEGISAASLGHVVK